MDIKDRNLFYIGGVVRDELLGKKSFDIDLTYNGNAIDFAKNIPNAEIIQINEPFGTVRIKLDNEEIDIASTRSESYPQKGHLPIIDKIGCSLKEDVLRRDFTINSLAKSTLTGKIIDYTNGLEDIEAKKIRVLHENSFIDDPTRILRALKFSIRFNFELEEKTRQLQEKYLNNINYDMSYKRLKKELIETFNLNSRQAFERFINQNIYKLISPAEFQLPQFDFSSLVEKYKPKNIWLIYVGLLPDISSLPLTKTENKIVQEFRSIQNFCSKSDYEIYKTLNPLSVEAIIMYSSINPEIALKYLDKLHSIKPQITGKDLLKLGIKPSEKYNLCFDYIIKNLINNPHLTLQDEIKLAKEFFNIF